MKIIVVSFGSSSKRYHYYLDPKGASVKIGWTLHRVMGTTRYGAYSNYIRVVDIYETDELPSQVKTLLKVGTGYTYDTGTLPASLTEEKETTLSRKIKERRATLKTKEEIITKAKADGVKFATKADEDNYYSLYCYIHLATGV